MRDTPRSRSVTYFAASSILVALVAAWVLVGRLERDDDPVDVSSGQPSRREMPPPERTDLMTRVISLAEPLDPEVPPGVIDADSEAPEATPPTAVESLESVPHHARDSNPYRQYVDVAVFEEWYADASDEDLVVAKLRIGQRLSSLVQDAVAQRFAEGLAEEREFVETRARDQEPDEDDRPGPKPSFGLYSSVRSEDMGSGFTMRERLTLPWEEFVPIYDLQDELNWINHQKSLREKAAGTK